MIISHPLEYSNHISIAWVDVVDILGVINAEWDHCQANAPSEKTDDGKNQPCKRSISVLDSGDNLQFSSRMRLLLLWSSQYLIVNHHHRVCYYASRRINKFKSPHNV